MRGFSHLSCVSKSSLHFLMFQFPDCIAFLAGIYILATLFSCSRGIPLKSLTGVCVRPETSNHIRALTLMYQLRTTYKLTSSSGVTSSTLVSLLLATCTTFSLMFSPVEYLHKPVWDLNTFEYTPHHRPAARTKDAILSMSWFRSGLGLQAGHAQNFRFLVLLIQVVVAIHGGPRSNYSFRGIQEVSQQYPTEKGACCMRLSPTYQWEGVGDQRGARPQ